MTNVSQEDEQQPDQVGRWSRVRRLMTSLPIFVILMGILVSVSHLTAVPWKYDPVDQNFPTLTPDTSVTFDNPDGIHLDKMGDYRVKAHHETVTAVREGTDERQEIRVQIREPLGVQGERPGVVFMHGAGYGTCDNSFGDVAETLASSGFVTAVLDKPVWSTTDANRDYPASARAYDQVINLLRAKQNVDPARVGIYATSESTWISSFLLTMDKDVAFQILLSPMVYSPRHAVGFFVAQDFAIAGANQGYQSVVRRLFSTDASLFNINSLDIDPTDGNTYAIPTLLAYGAKDVMTAQVEGVQRVLAEAHAAGNENVTVRSYAVSNHVLRLGDEANTGTPLADHYQEDMTNWAVGQVNGLRQTSPSVGGATIHQSIAVPTDLRGRPVLTIYMVALHILTFLLLLISLVMALVAAGVKIHHLIRHKGPALGFSHGFGGSLATVTGTTLASLVLFVAGLGQVIMAVVRLGWGGVPDPAGVSYWSWPVIQVVCALVIWAWSRIFTRMAEVASFKGVSQIPSQLKAHRAGGPTVAQQMHSNDPQPVVASTRLGLALFIVTTLAMFGVLLIFAFWGLFIYY